jgi:hypothetical protein
MEGKTKGTNCRQTALRIAVGLYLVGLGILIGVALDRMRFDRERSDVIGRYEQDLRERHEFQMALEKKNVASRPSPPVADSASAGGRGP